MMGVEARSSAGKVGRYMTGMMHYGWFSDDDGSLVDERQRLRLW